MRRLIDFLDRHPRACIVGVILGLVLIAALEDLPLTR